MVLTSSTSPVSRLAPLVCAFFAFAVSDAAGQYMYWTDSAAANIRRAHLDGSNIEDLIITGLSFPEGITIDEDGGKVYWADGGTQKIQRANLDGSGVEDVVINVPGVPAAIALDLAANKVYITDVATGAIMRANLDGSNVEDIVTTGLSTPRALALTTTGAPIPTTSQWGFTVMALLCLVAGTILLCKTTPSPVF